VPGKIKEKGKSNSGPQYIRANKEKLQTRKEKRPEKENWHEER